jgi:hypothetical protein
MRSIAPCWRISIFICDATTGRCRHASALSQPEIRVGLN